MSQPHSGADVHRDPAAALDRIVERYHEVADACDAVVVVGTDYTDVGSPTEFAYNARLAANLGSPVVLVLNGFGHTPEELRTMTGVAVDALRAEHGTLLAVVANRVDAADVLDDTQAITVTERLTGRQLDPFARNVILGAPKLR